MVTDAGQAGQQAGATDPHCKGQAEPPGPGRARDSEQLTLTDSLVQPVTAQPTHISKLESAKIPKILQTTDLS